MVVPPTLETDRLLLRPMRAEDWPAYGALMASDRARHMGGPFSRSAAWGMFCADHAQWDLFGSGALMIEDRAGAEVLGQVAVNAGPLFPEHELGWFVYAAAEGRGIAFEAASAMLGWARDTARSATLVSYIDPDNLRSCRLAERLGGRLDPHAVRPDPGDLVYRHFGN
ncbi:GNAT family N-acetyltransferase [Pelagibacterium montanilacus]|uniref:GNAT family N-acetyltransferase n=1 Tax=Pelagibacterium montanilacus TaxID=2185280 RepID=UPI000F8D126F|nr:GNAT family N-acetyltransferase [Pelagibacterium montanilacus]